MKGFEKLSVADIERRNLKITAPKPSKYRNVKVTIDGERFDSKHEANIWLGLKAQEGAREISDLTRQYPLDLCCPSPDQPDASIVVGRYIADYRWLDVKTDAWVYADAKSTATRTQIYRLKAKWVYLQYKITILEL